MENTNAHDERLLSTEETAQFLGTTPGTLSCWRCTRKYDLPFIKIGTLVRYRMSDLRDWVARRAVNLPTETSRARRRVRRARGARRAA
jgi:predicted DNA-binding transcriptional regulator AlpA